MLAAGGISLAKLCYHVIAAGADALSCIPMCRAGVQEGRHHSGLTQAHKHAVRLPEQQEA